MPIRILLVDDANFIRDMMKKQLRQRIFGAEVYEASDGNRAIAVLKANNIDLILSDWEMPNMSGEEFLRWVRNEEKYRETPFVMVSSRGDKEHVMTAVQAGVSDYLTKPFSADELLKKAEKQLIKIGKDPKINFARAAAKNQGHAFASIEALTGGKDIKSATITPKAKPSKTAATKPQSSTAKQTEAVNPLLNPPKIKPRASSKSGPKPAASAQLRFADATCSCEIKDISLQALSVVISTPESLPTIFDQTVVDIATEDDSLARINAYIHSIQAMENRLGSASLKLVVRFVDNDPQKMEVLSKFIAKR